LLEGFGNHESDGETKETYSVGIERGFRACEAIGQVNRTPGGLRRRIVLRQNEQHTRRALCIAHIHADDATLADCRGNDETIRGFALHRVFERVLGFAGHLQRTVDAVERAADRTSEIALRHGRSPQLSWAACASVARSVRRASGILKSLWPYPRAFRSAAMPAASN